MEVILVENVKGEFILRAVSSLTHNDAIELIHVFFPNGVKPLEWYSLNYFKHLMNSLKNNNIASHYDLGLSVIDNIKFSNSATDFVRGCVFFNYLNRQLHKNSFLDNNLEIISFDLINKKFNIFYKSPYSDEFIHGVIVGIMHKYGYNPHQFKIGINNGMININYLNTKNNMYQNNTNKYISSYVY